MTVAPATATAADQPRIIQAEWVWDPTPYPGRWQWRDDRPNRWERHNYRNCNHLRAFLEDLMDRPRWDRDWGKIREVRRRLRNDCPG